MAAARTGKRKRRSDDAKLTKQLAALIYASESEDSEKGERAARAEMEVETGEAMDMCGRCE